METISNHDSPVVEIMSNKYGQLMVESSSKSCHKQQQTGFTVLLMIPLLIYHMKHQVTMDIVCTSAFLKVGLLSNKYSKL